jgi:uncharacterized protein YgiM (DUF1202 family)
MVNFAHAAENLLQLVVTRPYLEMHSGPGRGYPVVYVVGRDEIVTVLYSRTDWYKVRAPRGQEGWVRRSDLARTVLASANRRRFRPTLTFRHRWEVGAGYGVYNRQNLVTAYVDFGLTESLDVKFVVQQALGTLDNRYIASIGLRHTFIPEWKWFSPDRRHRYRLPTHRGQGAARAAREQQPDGLRLAGRARLHHPTLHVARRLAPLCRLQQL